MYTFESRVRYSEVGSDGRLTLQSLLDYFQDVSTFQSEDLQVGLDYLEQMDMAWVLSSWQIVVNRYPALGEKIYAGTYPYRFKGFFGMRNFLLQTEDGETLACANSLWTLLNMKKMLPAKPTPLMLEKYVMEEPYPMEYSSRKIAVDGPGNTGETIEVRRRHLDTHEHVNNGQYVRMAMEYLPEKAAVRQMRAEYKKSAKQHDRIIPVYHVNGTLITVELNTEEGSPYAIVEFDTAGF